ncbi:MAG: energy-coupled thiamine transporter ThiT [Clostridia bacterium]|nr:energy-coupled thiamine transporter ThiT [Clostridia bacterium]
MFLSHLSGAYFDRLKIDGTKYYLYEEVWTEYATDFLTQVFLFSALALIVALIGVGVFVKFKKPEALSGFLKAAAAIAGGFIITVIVAMLALDFAKIAEKGYAEYNDLLCYELIPAIILGCVTVLGIAAAYIASLFSKKTFKITLITAGAAFGAALIALLVCLAVYYANGSAEENNGATITVTENAVLYVSAAVLILAIGLCAFFFGRKEKREFDSKSISYAAVCIASSFALSYIKLWSMPQGGSLTLASLLPLMLYAYMFGLRKGVMAGAVYGVLQAVQNPWLIHPAQFLLDYPVAFAGIGLAGLFAKTQKLEKLPQVQFALGAIVASVLRFAAHVLSGVFAFSEYSTLDNVWIYSLGYNAFVFPDIAVTIAVGAVILSVKPFLAQIKRIQTSALIKPKAEAVAAEETQSAE